MSNRNNGSHLVTLLFEFRDRHLTVDLELEVHQRASIWFEVVNGDAQEGSFQLLLLLLVLLVATYPVLQRLQQK